MQEENAAYEKAISNCESMIHEKIEEVELLRRKLEVRFTALKLCIYGMWYIVM